MKTPSSGRYLFTLVSLFALAVGEAFIAFKSGEGPNPLEGIFTYLLIVTGPLIFVGYAVFKSINSSLPMSLAWTCIIIGFFVQYVFYTTNDPSRILIMLISIGTYWVCGFLALISYGKK